MNPPLFRSAVARQPDAIIYLDGIEMPARSGESLITALLAAGLMTGRSEFDGSPRCGFCLMGACQDCTLWAISGERLRACMTEVVDGMELCRLPPEPGSQNE
ncbi:(2Fe-2S)-binding protein [Paracoccus sp. Z118]|uniref:(2Fe-2S)-binding protein n=1 Tax=Paracoccus sp. Z118 TaxID=2851017 RepID=UPI001C2C7F0B|nr:(2Fe-2S)-binding protein [Paracoccus sp. Z118]MBV0891910.1 (2Fe-2S)-binding protein [Paracoccus sp. Z118]